jgi:hypothetical protein
MFGSPETYALEVPRPTIDDREGIREFPFSASHSMPIATILRRSLFTLIAGAALVASGTARADDDFDVKVTPGHVMVTTKGKWHINKDYPWALAVGKEKVKDVKFALDEKTAKVEAPKGAFNVKGGICNGDQCRMFNVPVDVP